jgi:hypothetical protein
MDMVLNRADAILEHHDGANARFTLSKCKPPDPGSLKIVEVVKIFQKKASLSTG